VGSRLKNRSNKYHNLSSAMKIPGVVKFFQLYEHIRSLNNLYNYVFKNSKIQNLNSLFKGENGVSMLGESLCIQRG